LRAGSGWGDRTLTSVVSRPVSGFRRLVSDTGVSPAIPLVINREPITRRG